MVGRWRQRSSQEQVRSQLRKVLGSATFAKAERLRRFLEFIVEHTLSSPGELLKEMIVGIVSCVGVAGSAVVGTKSAG